MAVPLLPNALGPDAELAVEIAWGADVAATSSAEWTWTDITEYVRQDPGIAISLGRNDEASVANPATCTVELNNPNGEFSLGGESPNWPYVRRNVPVRVQVNPDGTGRRTLFFGYAVGFTPAWNLRGTVPTVTLEAAGTLRRLIQGDSPVVSPVRRGLERVEGLVAYWPCEDGKLAESIEAGANHTNMTIGGSPKLADNDLWLCSKPLITLNDGVLVGDVPFYELNPTSRQQVRAFFTFSDNEQTDQAVIMRIYTTGTVARWDMRYCVGGALDFKGYDRFGQLIVDQGAVAFNLKNTTRRLSVEMIQDGSLVVSGVNGLAQGAALYHSIINVPQVVGTVGRITQVVINPDGGIPDASVGHITVQNIVDDIRDVVQEMSAYDGDYTLAAGGRLSRVCDENAVPYSIRAVGEPLNSITDRMGPQPTATVMELLRECEAADQGMLFDGIEHGVSYTARQFRENRQPDLVIDAAQAKLAAPFGPTDDDQRTRNRVTVTRPGGTSYTHEDVTGPMGTAVVGTYDSSADVNTWQETALPWYAGWFVSQGTVQGYRYPQLSVDLVATPELAAAWTDLQPGMRVDITDAHEVLPGHPPGTISLMVEGISQTITGSTWRGTLKCSPYDVYRVGTTTGRMVLYNFEDASDLEAFTGDWVRTSEESWAGTYSIRPPDLGDSQSSTMSLDVSDADSVRVYYKVSSESGWDMFEILIDGVVVDDASGEVGWAVSPDYDVSSASTFALRYRKDTSVSEGDDTVWVDYVRVIYDDPSLSTEWTGRPESDGTAVSSAVSAGATSLPVTTIEGPKWTTDSADYPLDLDVGGVQVRATACSGTGSSQTFTIEPLSLARPLGAPVQLWDPPRVGL